MAGKSSPALPSEQTLPLLRRLWREHIRRYRLRLVGVLVLTVLMALSQAVYPAVIKIAVDMFARHDSRILYQVPLLVAAVTAVRAITWYYQTVSLTQVVLLVIRGLQERMFAHLTRADLARVEREPPAMLATRFTTDATTIREALGRAINGISDVVTVVGLVGWMIWDNWLLSLIAAVLLPVAGVPIQRIGRRLRRASGGMQEEMGLTAAMLNESFSQARTVRAYRLEAPEIARANGAFDRLYRALMSMTRSRSRLDPILEMLGGIAVALVLSFAGWQAARGSGGIGDFAGFVSALILASRPLRALGSLNAAVQEGLAGMARVFAVIDEPATIADRPGATPLPAGQGRVEFADVHFTYPDGRVGLDGLSFVAEPGRTVALVGPSGAGKSTALALIPRLQDATSGAVRLDGADVRSVTLASLRDALAYVGQDALLFDDTVASNIRMGHPGATQEQIEAAAQAAAAHAFIKALPAGYDTVVGTSGGRLSGGQRQRIALARALLRDPRVLLLDEATSALDAESEAEVQEALARLRRGRTTIIVAHRLSTVRDADLVVVIADGHAVEQGSHAALMERNGVFAHLVHTQALAQ